jgi:hypothetical protein
MRKHRDHTEFAGFVRHNIPRPISLAVPFGAMEGRERLAPEEHTELLERNRSRYCASSTAARPGLDTAPSDGASPHTRPTADQSGPQLGEQERL